MPMIPILTSRTEAYPVKQKKLASVLAALALLFIVGITATTTFGQQIAPDPTPTTPEPLIVGIELSPPFVMKEDDRYTGMSIELWETLASRMGRTYEYREFDTVGNLINATAANEIDVAVSNITVNEFERSVSNSRNPGSTAGCVSWSMRATRRVFGISLQD